MKWLSGRWNKWFPPYNKSKDFISKLGVLKIGSVVCLRLKGCNFINAYFIILYIGDSYFGGNALLMGPMGYSTAKEGVRIDFENITFLEDTGVNVLKEQAEIKKIVAHNKYAANIQKEKTTQIATSPNKSTLPNECRCATREHPYFSPNCPTHKKFVP